MLAPYVPHPVRTWLTEEPEVRWRALDASIAFADISGFTELSERLAARGRIGAEELTECLSTCFVELLGVAYADGASLLKFGGDALLLLFDGDDHAVRAARAACRMRAALRAAGPIRTGGGHVRLRMSVGVHSGTVHLFLVGGSHRELLVTGPAASAVLAAEKAAGAGQIVVTEGAAQRLPGAVLGDVVPGVGRLLRDRGHGSAPDVRVVEPAVPESRWGIAIPETLRDHQLCGPTESEHRQVAVAFVGFSGIAGLLAERGPEGVAAALDDLVRHAQDACASNGATFVGSDADSDGGKLIFAGGAPYSLGRDVTRTLRAVRSLLERSRALSLRGGVNAGHVFAGAVGPSYRRTYTVMGDAVNLAARLMASAPNGQCLATATTLEAAAAAFERSAVPPFHVKGKRNAVDAVCVGPEVADHHPAAVPGAFVGREAEVASIREEAEAAFAGSGRIVSIGGDAGSGKTRLVGEALRAGDGDTRIEPIVVECAPYEELTSYHVVRRLLQAVVGDTTATMDLAAVLHAAAMSDDGAAAEALADVFPSGGHGGEGSVPQLRRRRAALVVARVMAARLDGPAAVVFEDVHWMDAASAELLAIVATTIGEHPWLLVTTRRPTPGGLDLGRLVHRHVDLEPLDEGAVRALIASLTRHRPVEPRRVTQVVARAGGNPLFVHELVRAALSSPHDDDELPDTLEAAVAEELDRLPRVDRQLLRQLSVLGTVVDLDLATAVVDLPDGDGVEQLADRLRGALADHLVPHGDEAHRFRHTVHRDVAYASLSYRQRRELHRRAGMALEARMTGAAPAPALSLHFHHAGDRERTWRYAKAAASAALDVYAAAEAAALHRRALQAAAHLALDPADVADVWGSMGDALHILGDHVAATSAFRSASRLVRGRPLKQADLSLRCARIASMQSRAPMAVRWVRRGLRELDGDDSLRARELRAALYALHASVRVDQGRCRDALRWGQRAIAEAEAASDRAVLAQAYLVVDIAAHQSGRHELAVNAPKALRIFEELRDEPNRAVTLNTLGAFAYHRGRWEDAADLYQQSRAINARIGNEVEAGVASCNAAEILIDQGRLTAAEGLLEDVERCWRPLGFRYGLAIATRHRARVALRRGDAAGAEAQLAEAREVFEAFGVHAKVREVDVWRAECRLLVGDPDGASRLLRAVEAAEVPDELLPLVQRLLAAVAAQRGDLDEAVDRLRTSLASARARSSLHQVALALGGLLDLERAGGPAAPAGASHELQGALAELAIDVLPVLPLGHRTSAF